MLSNDFSVAVMVSDAKKSAEWYKEKLGFDISTEDDHWITAWRKGAPWRLHLCEGKLEPGNSGICFYSENVQQAVSELKKNGVKFSQDYTKTDWGGEIAKLDDPDGNVFWLSKGSP
ncbi:MAG: VOC family protein [Nitrososphaerales archaeon]